MKPATMKLLSLILSLAMVIASVVLCQQIISNSIVNQQDKTDYAELNQVKYGLFSIDEWKRQITAILTDEINRLYLSKDNEKVIRKHIEVLLNTLIDKVDKKVRKGNEGTAGGQLKQSFMNMFINLDEIKKGIPEYADAVMHELTKSKSKEQLKTALNDQLDQYASQTFDTQDMSRLSSILVRTGSVDIESARSKLNEDIAARQDLIVKQAMLMILLSLVLFAWFGFGRQQLFASRYMVLLMSLITLLISGVTTPMIDMEATISQMSIMLMGHPIHFENQVLYFQSKSILDVFWIMITHQEIQMKLVGVLLITFSIVFPLLKLASTLVYYFDYRHARENPMVKFFVTSAGKWSMADVMVVAIFMAYIGFNGIITSQLGHLSSTDQELVILTTNGTSLQPGYYLFLTYTLLALFLSEILTSNPRDQARRNAQSGFIRQQ